MVTGLLTILLWTLVGAAVILVVLYHAAIVRVLVRVARWLHLVPPPPPVPEGPPIGKLARDLRRLRAATLHHEAGESQVRRVAAVAAYDQALADACRELEIPDTLTELPLGTDRDAERLRIEWLLEQRGLRLT